ncbi:MAG: COX15/CtaA family protein [Proteobacteria bacterium]|nr:COX15/CtaA family protein [Pseudomonadota bacterium]
MFRTGEHDPRISRWLILCLIIIFAMAIFDSVNRLTPSYASALNQDSAHSFLAPLDAAEWGLAFDRFRQSSEYKKMKPGMELADFKSVFWYYYTQRTLGRLIIPVFLLPFLYFWWRDQIKPGLTPKLISIFLLALLQGLIGWYMAQDYLADNPRGSVYLLTAHLLNTVLIYGYMLWVILGLRDLQPYMPMRFSELAWWRFGSLLLTALVLMSIISGGFVTALRAGSLYNTFPLMEGHLIPHGLDRLSPWYLNLFENKLTVQFEHRILTIATALVLIAWYFARRRLLYEPVIKKSFKLVGLMVVIQVFLGIATLLLRAPVWLGAMHWAGALLLFGAMLFNVHALSRL